MSAAGRRLGSPRLFLGAISFAYCRECIGQGAEPLWMVHGTINNLGLENLSDWVKELRSYRAGRYIDWDEIVACYVPDDGMAWTATDQLASEFDNSIPEEWSERPGSH